LLLKVEDEQQDIIIGSCDDAFPEQLCSEC
jgi:hypothetical protein